MRRQVLIVAVAFAGAFTLAVAAMWLARDKPLPADLPVLWPAKSISAFELTDQHGQAFDPARIEGDWTFWYFGYTSCPDVCPVTLTVMNTVRERLLDSNQLDAEVQLVFVSVDPQRDDAQRIARYVGFFGSDFIGTTGTETSLQALSTQFGVHYEAEPAAEDGQLFRRSHRQHCADRSALASDRLVQRATHRRPDQ